MVLLTVFLLGTVMCVCVFCHALCDALRAVQCGGDPKTQVVRLQVRRAAAARGGGALDNVRHDGLVLTRRGGLPRAGKTIKRAGTPACWRRRQAGVLLYGLGNRVPSIPK